MARAVAFALFLALGAARAHAQAAAAAAAAPAARDTTGTSLPEAPGFKFGSNVAGYLDVSADLCEIKALLKPTSGAPRFAAAEAIYKNGKNSRKSNGDIRTLQGVANSDGTGELFFDAYAKYFKSKTFLDDAISKALAGAAPFRTPLARREVAGKGMEVATQMAYIMHEMDEAAAKIKEGNVGAAKGAPHNVDEVVALYVGGQSSCAPWGSSNRRAAKFGTQATCTASKTNQAAIAILNDAYKAAAAGNMAAFMAARARLQSLLALTNVQATLEYAELLEAARAAGQPTDEYQAEAYAFFRAIEPLVAQASAASAATLNTLLMPGNPVPAGVNKQVAAALARTYAGLGITAADVGTYGAKGLAC